MLPLVSRDAVIADGRNDAIIKIQDAVAIALDAILVQIVLLATLVARVIIDLLLLDNVSVLILHIDFVKLLFALGTCISFLGPVEDAFVAISVLATVDIRPLLRCF